MKQSYKTFTQALAKGIRMLVLDIDGVEGITYLRGRKVGEDMHVEIDIKVDRSLSVRDGDRISEWIEEKLMYELSHVRDVRVMLTPVEVVGRKRKPIGVPIVVNPS